MTEENKKQFQEFVQALPESEGKKTLLATLEKTNWEITPEAEEILDNILEQEENKLDLEIADLDEELSTLSLEREFAKADKLAAAKKVKEELEGAEKRMKIFMEAVEQVEEEHAEEAGGERVEELKKKLQENQ